MRNDAPELMQEKGAIETTDFREAKSEAVRGLIESQSKELCMLGASRSVDNKSKARFILDNPEGMIALLLCVLLIIWIVKSQ